MESAGRREAIADKNPCTVSEGIGLDSSAATDVTEHTVKWT